MNTIHRRCSICGTDNPPQAVSCLTCGQPLKTTTPLLAETDITSADDVLAPNVLLKQRYRIIGQVGQGGFGAIYKAEDTQFDNRLVAIKEIRLSGLKPHE